MVIPQNPPTDFHFCRAGRLNWFNQKRLPASQKSKVSLPQSQNFIDLNKEREIISFFCKVSKDKIKPIKELIPIVRDLQSEGRRVALTNGCFDLIHPGHVHLLNEARRLADCLVVAINTDDSLRSIKGDKRPLVGLKQRLGIISSFQMVDYVTSFEQDTPEDIIRQIRPDILVKGGEYSMDEIVGRQIVWDTGGEVVQISPLEGRSTSAIIEEIISRFK